MRRIDGLDRVGIVADPTHGRGQAGTGAEPFLIRVPRRFAFVAAIGVALLLHLPALPSRLWGAIGLYMLLQPDGAADEEDEIIVPIDLDLLHDSTNTPETKPPSEAPPPEPPAEDKAAAEASAKPPKPKDPGDAGSPDAHISEAGIDADKPDAPVDAPFDALADAPADAPVDAPADAPADVSAGDSAVAQGTPPDASGGLLPLPFGVDASVVDAPVEVAALDAGADAAVVASVDGGAPVVRDPLSQAGSPSQLAGKDPNIQILIAGDRLRTHPLSEAFGKVLRAIPEWKDFFGTTNIDPIKDFDHMLLAGPKFKDDSSKVVAIMDYNRPDGEMKSAVNQIVTNAKGEWLKDAPVQAAQAKTNKADRIFALLPEKNLIVVLPAKEKDQLKKLKSLKSFNKSSPVGIALSMVNPARPFSKIFKLPDSLKWLRLALIPTSDGGADVTIETLDSAASDDVKTHAKDLTTAYDLARATARIEVATMQIEFLPKAVFVADGNLIRTSTHFTRSQLMAIIVAAREDFEERAQKRN